MRKSPFLNALTSKGTTLTLSMGRSSRPFECRRGSLLKKCLVALDVFQVGIQRGEVLGECNGDVVEDSTRTNNPCLGSASATGAWSFGKLVTDMANTPVTGVSPEDFVRRWLNSWLIKTTVNGEPLPARAALFAKVIKPWVLKSGASGPWR